MDPAGAWRTFFSVAAEAAAALVGLIFVALSVNISEILKYPHLPSRAGAAMGALMLIVTTGLTVLAPQPLAWMGAEILPLTGGAWALQAIAGRAALGAHVTYHRPTHDSTRRREIFTIVLAGQAQVAPFLIGAILMTLDAPSGLACLAFGCVAVFILAVLNAWVLLVEILR